MGNLTPKIILTALIQGVLPTLVWLWFWLTEEKTKHNRGGLILVCFIAGAISVLFVLPIEKFIDSQPMNQTDKIILWATAEEIIKYLVLILLISKARHVRDTMDFAMYIITIALGFAALENTLFLLKPEAVSSTVSSFLTGNLRFLGATLLHSVASAIVGIMLGLAYYKNKPSFNYALIGLFIAITLHAVFNFFIMNPSGENFFETYGFLWVTTIIIILLFEKLRRMTPAWHM